MGTWSLRAHPSQDPKGGSSFQAKHRPQPPVLSFLLKTPADGMEASLMSSCKPFEEGELNDLVVFIRYN